MLSFKGDDNGRCNDTDIEKFLAVMKKNKMKIIVIENSVVI
jgi:hypothetical protein